jgi:hypothetical protein
MREARAVFKIRRFPADDPAPPKRRFRLGGGLPAQAIEPTLPMAVHRCSSAFRQGHEGFSRTILFDAFPTPLFVRKSGIFVIEAKPAKAEYQGRCERQRFDASPREIKRLTEPEFSLRIYTALTGSIRQIRKIREINWQSHRRTTDRHISEVHRKQFQ